MKTRIIIQLSLLFLAVFLILSLVPRTGEAQQTTGARIIWNPDIKIEPAKDMNALQLVNNKVDQAAFTNRADSILRKLLGKTGVAITRERIGTADNMLAWIDKDDPSSMIMQDTRNGNLFFSNRMNRYTSLDNVTG
jgi:hypothetical protein